MGLNLAVLCGDGVGPAVATQWLDVLQAVGDEPDHSLNVNEGLMDGVAIDTLGRALSYETLCIIVECVEARFERPIVWNLA